MVVYIQDQSNTVSEAGRQLGCQEFSCTLPQDWVDKFHIATGFYPVGHFVWDYDDSPNFGLPRPLTVAGHVALRQFDVIEGTSYLVEDAPVYLS